MEKDKIGSISHIVNQDKFQKAWRYKCEINETIHVWHGYLPPVAEMKKSISSTYQHPDTLRRKLILVIFKNVFKEKSILSKSEKKTNQKNCDFLS